MTLWRLEWTRLVRTRRWLALAGVYLLFGFTGPITARYLDRIVARAGGGIRITLPPPQPADGITQYVSNAQQLGILAVVAVAAAALAVDAIPEMSVFLRTRTRRVWQIYAPRLVVNAAAAGAAFTAGALAAWYETRVLLGGLPAGRMALGIALGVEYLAFAVAVVAAATAVTRTVLAGVLVSLLVLLGLPLVALLSGLRAWMPSQLVGALDALVRGASPGGYVRPAAVAATASAVLVWFALRAAARREL